MSELVPVVPADHGSPFDAIRRTRSDGSEYWSARDLMPLLGYATWERFSNPIERAQVSAGNQGIDVNQAFSQVREEGTGGRNRNDYELSRFAAYLVAMNGDPNKNEVAAAQAYFAVQTHRAETLDSALSSGASEDDALEQFSMMRTMLDNMERNHLAAKAAKAQAERAQRDADEARIAALEAKSEAALANARMNSIENKTGYISALGYAKLHPGVPTDIKSLQRLGARAGKIARAMGTKGSTTSNEMFGTVNIWSPTVWDAAVESLRSEDKL